MTRHRKAFGLALGLMCVSAWWVPCVRAYEEQASLDVSAGYLGAIAADVLEPNGPLLEIGGAIGVSDLFVLRGAAGYAPRFGHGEVQQAGRLRFEAAYLIDVVRWVPFVGLGATLWGYDAGDSFGVRPGGHLLFGVDYLWSRTWIFGLDLRTGVLFEGGSSASLNEGQLRVSRMFDLF